MHFALFAVAAAGETPRIEHLKTRKGLISPDRRREALVEPKGIGPDRASGKYRNPVMAGDHRSGVFLSGSTSEIKGSNRYLPWGLFSNRTG